MTALPKHQDGLEPQKRVRASEHALKTALKAMQDCGLSVGKVCINGGRIEIHTTHVEGEQPEEDNGGLKDW